ncbi:MAG TPA: molybdenum cofactor guanylyltransferase [Vicinamibacteria bacterium]|nr:molybdenum cofactor guanylyltransferase [Vicinamibacteria bacterium]
MIAAGPQATGFAVAGGRSRRMVEDKALLPWPGGDLLGHTLARLQQVSAELRILSGPQRRYLDRGLPVDVDPFDDGGPLVGILAGLEAVPGRSGLFLAVDLPLVPVLLLRRLLALADEADAVVPESRRGAEPLCAVYGQACRGPIRQRLALGDLRMSSFWPTVRVRRVSPAEVAAFGDPDRLFLNVNEPADYRRASALRLADA